MSRALGCALLVFASACSEDLAEIEGYRGPVAYPNQRAEFAAKGRRLGYVANRSSDTVSVVDLDSMTLLGSAPVGRDPVDIDGPSSLVLDPARGIAYVALSYPESIVSAHQAAAGVEARFGYVQVLSLFDLTPLGELRVEASATELALSRNGEQLLVSHSDRTRSSQVSADIEVRRANLGLIGSPSEIVNRSAKLRLAKLCVVPSVIVYGKDDSRAFVLCAGEDSFAVVDTADGADLARVPSGASATNKPEAMVADASRERLLVSNQVSRSVVAFSASDSPQQLSVATITGLPRFAAFVSESEFVVPSKDPDGLALVEVNSGAVVREVQFSVADCENPNDAQVTRDGRLYLVCEGTHYTPGAVVELDPTTLEVKGRVNVGIYPERLAILEP